MTLRWREVRIAFLYLFYSQSHTEAPVVCAVFSSLELLWNRDGATSPPKSAAIPLARQRPVCQQLL